MSQKFVTRFCRVAKLGGLVVLAFIAGCRSGEAPTAVPPLESPVSGIISNSQIIPQYEKFELSFLVKTDAENVQFPFDPDPPAGVPAGIGVSVDALFTPDDWQTIFIQPAFFYQEFLDETRSNQEWLYPTDNMMWKVRFTPNAPGEWQYKVRVEDANGRIETTPASFTVSPSENKGFIRVSQQDSRYFEYDNGAYFPGLGINLELPEGVAEFKTLSENGMKLIRTYLPSQFSIWGAAWSPWRAVGSTAVGQETNARLRFDAATPFNRTAEDPPLAIPGHDFFLWLTHDETLQSNSQQGRHYPCAVIGWNTPRISVQADTNYRLRVRYRLEELEGAQNPALPTGLTVKTADWLWSRQDETDRCSYPGTGELLAASYADENGRWMNYSDPDFDGWHQMEATFNSGTADFLPRLWLAIENAAAGHALIDHVWIEAINEDGSYGPNIIYKASMAPHLYFDQRSSFAFDKVLMAAEEHDLAFKLVLTEKGDFALNAFEVDGSLTPQPVNQSGLFFGNGREMTKIRWLQQAYWRYVQARWGYSTSIHSWELLNEGSPGAELHHILTDELGKFMQTAFIPPNQTTYHPNTHLVTTSTWSGYAQPFWKNEAYAYIDYADIHHYARMIPQQPFQQLYDGSEFYDTAAFTFALSEGIGSSAERNPGMPLVRGELGFIFEENDLFRQNVSDGLWLHNLVWAGINAGGLMELYWTGSPTRDHIWSDSFDHRHIYGAYYQFVQDIPLNNGRYQPIQAQSDSSQLRLLGQLDAEAGRAHLWLQNSQHTWKNAADGVPIPAINATVQLAGFAPNEMYQVAWIDTWTNETIRAEQVVAAADGRLILTVSGLETDVALKIRP